MLSQEAANINLIVIKRKFLKRWWSTMQPMWTERTTILSHKSLNTKTTTYSDGNVGPGFRQAQTCCGFKPLNKIPTTPLFCGFVISLDYKLYFFYLYVLVFMTFSTRIERLLRNEIIKTYFVYAVIQICNSVQLAHVRTVPSNIIMNYQWLASYPFLVLNQLLGWNSYLFSIICL